MLTHPSSEDTGYDALLDLQLRVARRADELTKTPENNNPLQLECWLQAEAEIFAEFSPPPGRGTASTAHA